MPAEVHRIAGKGYGVGLSDLDAPFKGYERADFLLRWPVEGVGIVEQPPPVERAEAGIEMIEAGIRQPQRDRSTSDRLFDAARSRRVRTKAVAKPQDRQLAIE